ncbi:MAG: glycosyltransferase family 4 protein [Planctomycetota bacterium]|jgi:glycosyltransferase involved in cell wall biosynthesis
MRISLDITSAIGDRTGVGTYTRELGRALLRRRGPHSIRLVAHVFRHPGWHARIVRLFGRAPVRASRLIPHGAILEMDRILGWPHAETLFGPCDVFHGTNFLAPPCRSARAVVTVHDLAFVRFAAEIPVAHRYRRYIRRAVTRADRVIAVSEATRRDVIELFGVEASRVAVVHEGAPSSFPVLSEAEWAEARRRLRIPERFLLFVGTLEPRKNLVRLLGAFRRVAARLRNSLTLVIAGRLGWSYGPILEAVEHTRRIAPVVLTGFVPTSLRNTLYSRAAAVVLPSLYEGFGLPVLEAFTGGAPVVAGDAGALREVAGDAALFADPRDEESIAERIVQATEDEDLRGEMIERGRRRVALFSWDRASRETFEVYANA